MKIGADPEFFIVDSYKKIINAAKVVKNTNSKPLSKADLKIYHDNVLVEFSFDPVFSEIDFVNKIGFGINSISDFINPYKISTQAFAELDEDELTQENARVVGCNPDLCAYTLAQNELPKNFFTKTNFRTSGGHIHIGGVGNDLVLHPFMKPIFVYMLDLFLGIPSVLMDNGTDTMKRRTMFGKAGCHRDKPYGIEYRVLSPFWLRNPATVSLVYRLTHFVFQSVNDGLHKKFWHFEQEKLKTNNPQNAYECYGYDANEVRNAIDECDANKAMKIFNFICNFMPNQLIKMIENEMKISDYKIEKKWLRIA